MNAAESEANSAEGKAVEQSGFGDKFQAFCRLGGEWWARWCGWILLIVAPFIAYSNAFEAPFVFDGHNYVQEMSWIGDIWEGGEAKRAKFFQEAQTRALVYLTFALDHRISRELTAASGKQTGHLLPVWHTTSLSIHIIAGLALYGVARRAFRSRRFGGRFDAYSERFALIVALLWVVHPLDTQSVTYLYQRHESMMGMFYFLTLYLFTRFVEAGRARWFWAGASIFACLCGMASKEAMATAPLVVLWYDRVFVADRWSQILIRRTWFHALLFATTALLINRMSITPYANAGIADTTRVSPQEYALTQFGVVRHYMKLSVYPDELNIDYCWRKTVDWPLPKAFPYVSFASPKFMDDDWRPTVFPAIFVLGILALTMIAVVRAPAIGFLAGTFFVILSPTSTIVPIVDFCFEHRMYVPLAPFLTLLLVLANFGFDAIYGRISRSAEGSLVAKTLFVALVASTFIVLTYRRNQDYRSRVAIWQDVARKVPHSNRANYNFGVYLQIEGTPEEVDQAHADYRQRLKTDPNAELKVESSPKSIDLAIEQYKKTLELDSNYADAYLNLGNLYFFRAHKKDAKGEFEYDEAARHAFLVETEKNYSKYLEFQPQHVESRHHLADTYYHLGEFPKALEHVDKLLEVEPTNALGLDLRPRIMEQLNKPTPP